MVVEKPLKIKCGVRGGAGNRRGFVGSWRGTAIDRRNRMIAVSSREFIGDRVASPSVS